MDDDINDAFFGIALAENSFLEQGREEGFAAGRERGWKTGFELGVAKGAQIGSEVAFYRGFSSTTRLLNVTSNDVLASKKIIKVLDALDHAIDTIPSDISPDSNVVSSLDTARAKFKQICSLMNVNQTADEKPKMDF